MSSRVRAAAACWLIFVGALLAAYGFAELAIAFPPPEHRLAYAVAALASLLALAVLMEPKVTARRPPPKDYYGAEYRRR